jgi:protein TonB
MPTMPMRTDPYVNKTFALVLALHLGILWLVQALWTSEPAQAVRKVVAAQLIQEFRAPEPLKPEPAPPVPKMAPPQATPVLPAQAPTPPSLTQYALPAITAAPTTPAPPVQATATPAAALKHAPVVVAASARMDSCAKPRYPSASERLREEGVVSLKFLISENGQVLSGSVEKTSGYTRLDDAALAALSLCKFRPAMVDGKPRQEWSALKYRWELND